MTATLVGVAKKKVDEEPAEVQAAARLLDETRFPVIVARISLR